MKPAITGILAALLVLISMQSSTAATMEDCLLEALQNAGEDTTVGSLRQRCSQATPAPAAPDDEPTVLERRIASEYDTMDRDYILTLHNPNYILLFTYNDKVNREPWIPIGTPEQVAAISEEEMVFQISGKMPLWRNMFSKNMDLYFGYTQKNWWQIYTNEEDVSAPFRETNYEPEVFARYFGGPGLPFGGKIAGLDAGYIHQSNGKAGSLSRSWDRVIGRAAFDYGDLAFLLRAWYAFDESDENPSMHRYLGYGDLRAIWAPNRNTFTAMFRPGTEKYAYELTWSFQVTSAFRLYAQWFNGYGESLLDYNVRTNRYGIGIAFSDFLMNE
ncbi:MAG: phospholipase A [Gammaproteobacteria bacterium]